jgi:hypothetical protein
MPNVTITNVSLSAVFINFLYVELQAGEATTVYRSASDLMSASRLQELVEDGLITVDIDYTPEEKVSGFDIFPGLSLPEGTGTLFSQNVRYVDVSAQPDGDGSTLNPYQKIQDAIDDLESIGGFSVSNPGVVYIQSGTYDEAVVIRTGYLHLIALSQEGRTRNAVRIEPTTTMNWPLTLTNATQASLEAYDVSGVYSDLVNQGDRGAQRNFIKGIQFVPAGGSAVGSVRALGVKGDQSPDTTGFGWYLAFYMCSMDPGSGYPGLFIKNAGIVSVYNSYVNREIVVENSYGCEFFYSFVPKVESTYDAASLDGKNAWTSGHNWWFYQNTLYNHLGWVFDGGAVAAKFTGSTLGFRGLMSLTVQNVTSGSIDLEDCAGGLDLILDGDCDLEVRGSTIIGDITLNSGPGTATWDGGGWTGELTDPDDKLALIPTKRFAYPATATGTVTAKVSDRVRYNTSGGSFQINAPASPNVGDSFAVKEIASDTTNVTVSGNGNNIEHPVSGVVAASAVFGVSRIGVTWEFDGTDWIIP